MQRIISYIIENNFDGYRIDRFLKEQEYSAQAIIRLKKIERGITVNGIWKYVADCIHAGDHLQILAVEEAASEGIIPVRHEIPIVYEDEDILIADKPADMPIHPSMQNTDNTLANAIMYLMAERGESMVFRCINRLDRDTTGLTLIAKNFVSSSIAYGRMKQRRIQRKYIAIAAKKDEESNAFLESEGRIELAIARKDESLIERCVDEVRGENAITNYSIKEKRGRYYLLELSLETGRTHQIRVHLSYLGFPLLGDSLYGGECKRIKRTALHSASLFFEHPIRKEKMVFSSKMPEDMQTVWDEICQLDKAQAFL